VGIEAQAAEPRTTDKRFRAEQHDEEWTRMTEEQVMISNKLGLHARAAAKLVHVATAFEAEIFIGTDHEQVNAKSILGLLTLAATRGTPILIRADGADETEAVKALVALFEDRFGEGE
jgi:phosphocarrier protein